jgi:hypothetical protein
MYPEDHKKLKNIDVNKDIKTFGDAAEFIQKLEIRFKIDACL